MNPWRRLKRWVCAVADHDWRTRVVGDQIVWFCSRCHDHREVDLVVESLMKDDDAR